jgi:hypothetical protein
MFRKETLKYYQRIKEFERACALSTVNVKKEKYIQSLRATKFNPMLIIFQFRAV